MPARRLKYFSYLCTPVQTLIEPPWPTPRHLAGLADDTVMSSYFSARPAAKKDGALETFVTENSAVGLGDADGKPLSCSGHVQYAGKGLSCPRANRHRTAHIRMFHAEHQCSTLRRCREFRRSPVHAGWFQNVCRQRCAGHGAVLAARSSSLRSCPFFQRRVVQAPGDRSGSLVSKAARPLSRNPLGKATRTRSDWIWPRRTRRARPSSCFQSGRLVRGRPGSATLASSHRPIWEAVRHTRSATVSWSRCQSLTHSSGNSR